MKTFPLGTEESLIHGRVEVKSVKFVPKEKWIVAGDSSGIIRVISYDTEKEVKNIFQPHKGTAITSLAIHPKQPLLLSADAAGMIKLQSWQGDTTNNRTFSDENCRRSVSEVRFNPKDSNTFVSTEEGGRIKVSIAFVFVYSGTS